MEYSLECICEHEQRQRRSTENDHTFDIGEEMDDDDVEYESNPQKFTRSPTHWVWATCMLTEESSSGLQGSRTSDRACSAGRGNPKGIVTKSGGMVLHQ